MPVKEYQIIEHFLGTALKDEVMKIMPVQKQTRAGQRTRFKVGLQAGFGTATWFSALSIHLQPTHRHKHSSMRRLSGCYFLAVVLQPNTLALIVHSTGICRCWRLQRPRWAGC
jgi:hypothetical protein